MSPPLTPPRGRGSPCRRTGSGAGAEESPTPSPQACGARRRVKGALRRAAPALDSAARAAIIEPEDILVGVFVQHGTALRRLAPPGQKGTLATLLQRGGQVAILLS